MRYKYIQVLIVFSIIFVSSLITESIPYQYLGDWKCKGGETVEVLTHSSDGSPYYYSKPIGCDHVFSNYTHPSTKHWGFRHWLLIIAGLFFFIWRMVDIFSRL